MSLTLECVASKIACGGACHYQYLARAMATAVVPTGGAFGPNCTKSKLLRAIMCTMRDGGVEAACVGGYVQDPGLICFARRSRPYPFSLRVGAVGAVPPVPARNRWHGTQLLAVTARMTSHDHSVL